MGDDLATLASYAARAPTLTFSGAAAPHRFLAPFLARLTPRSRVLELGCGTGEDAFHMIQRGFAVDATDGVPAIAARARERFGIDARSMRFGELKAERDYDAVWAHASLLHVPSTELPAILAAIRKALVPDGWHFANYRLGDGDRRDRHGRLHNLPEAEPLCALYRMSGFVIEDRTIYAEKACGGGRGDWIALTVRRHENA